ncbi:MAG: MFS transporter [Opitutales bacterium]
MPPTSVTPSNDDLKFREKLGYGLGDTASNFFFHTFNILLLNYYVEAFGLAAAAVGTMFLVTKLFDAFTDVAMGLVADRTRSRWGRFRPYILWTAVPFGLIGYAMFANPDLSGNGKLVYAYITYSLMMIAYTVINIPYSSLLGVISPRTEERETVSTYRFVCAFGAQLVISAFVLPLKDVLGGGDDARGYQLTMAIFAVLSIVLWLYTFSSTKERVEPPPEQKMDLKGDFREVMRNWPWVVMVVVALFTLMNVAVRGGATIFFLKYYTGAETDRISIFFLTGTAAMVAGAASTKLFTRFLEKRTIMIWLTGLNALTMVFFFFIPADQFWLMVVVNAIGTYIVGPTPAVVWAMYADCADYGEWKSGRRTTGLIFSGALFSQKMGLAIGAGLSGWILGAFGFVANQSQSLDSVLGIRLMFSVFPGTLAFLAAMAVLFYPLREAKVKEIEIELARRRAARVPSA